MGEIHYGFTFGITNHTMKTLPKLIKGIVGDFGVLKVFSASFKENWQTIMDMAVRISKSVLKYEQKLLKDIKERVLGRKL